MRGNMSNSIFPLYNRIDEEVAEMTRKKKRVILFLLLFLLLAVTGMLVWIFFLPKKYTVMYHISGNRTIESAEVILYGRQESGEYGYSMYLLEDKDNLEKIEKALSGMKMYPCHITKSSDITEIKEDDRNWLLHLNGKNDTYLSIGMIGTDRKGQSIINHGLMNNGVGTKDYLDIIGNVVVSAEEEMNVWETLLDAVKNEIGKITVQDMLELADTDCHDWIRFEKYLYRKAKTEEEKEILQKIVDRSKLPDSMRTDLADIFETDTEDFVLMVWALDSIVEFSDRTAERTREVCLATVYRQDGEYMDLYDAGLEEFLGYNK